ncbi:MAG: tyrosine--tRNA ligase [Chitinophagaceae bacterium]|nr:MAG: tyrosyl-tRNA synthetase [Bacteroidetes bacterium OLB11]MCC6448168.1 tyrosine--tRNA ligase [Chitinophagaceae bacterium]HMN32874.1 tyrosine--tRNA ligase [Chitinophagaceae bacterium]
MVNLIEELKWRGLLQDIIPGTEEQLNKEMTTGYIGFDPTADSLHIGNLVPIILLIHLQKAGHKPIALLGGATGRVGDPSGKSTERNMLPLEQIQHNLESQKIQLQKFLNFDPTLKNHAEILNNYEWLKEYSFLDFIREVGKYITVNYMLSKDSVQNRLENGMSFTEFSYQLIQGYDFYYLNEKHQVKLQMGGSDQWGNIVTGTELIRKKSGNEVFAFTAPLVKKADGSKFGKSESGNVWLDKTKTSVYKFYQFWLNTSDEDAEKYISVFTFLPKNEINELIKTHHESPHLRILQKTLAKEVTTMVHSADEYEYAVQTSLILFGNDTTNALKKLTESELLDIMDGVPTFSFEYSKIKAGVDIISFLTETHIFESKAKAREMTGNGGVSLNKQKVTDLTYLIQENDVMHEKYIIVQKGKKNYHLVVLQ